MRVGMWLSVVVGLSGCVETGISTVNRAPQAEILLPSAKSDVSEGYTFVMEGIVNDGDGANTSLTWRFLVDGTEQCGGEVDNDEGNVSCEVLAPTGATELELLLEARDPQGALGTDVVTTAVVPTGTPQVAVTAPLTDGIYYSGELINFEGTVSDAEDDPEDLTLVWSSSRDGDLKDANSTANSDGTVSGFSLLTEGQHAITLTATDTTGKTGSDNVVIDVGPPNTPPSCAITAPEDGSADELGTLVTFRGTADDVDVPSDWLSVEWSSDKDGVLGTVTPSSSGEVLFGWSNLSANTHTITMTITDEVGATCTDLIFYSVGTPPTLTLDLPVADQVFTVGALVDFQATVSDAEASPTALDMTWTSSLDGAFSTQGADSTGLAAFSTSTLSAGPHALTVRATDPDGLYTERTRNFRINTPPTQPGVTVTPTSPTTTNNLTAVFTIPSTDADSDPVALTWSWYADMSYSPPTRAAAFPAAPPAAARPGASRSPRTTATWTAPPAAPKSPFRTPPPSWAASPSHRPPAKLATR